ncbi:cortactin binding protein N-terminal like nausicaa isoform X2 [Lycorma delicatula]|uniref:cortactin binding protein N-terminal like nausicaa isoform X2 n=1 Tax=Lycorma delicatula TaxID=130591 RepID=UPI003F518298
MASNLNNSMVQCQGSPTKSGQLQKQNQALNYEPLDKSSSNTLKRNPKMELCKADLLKLLSYLEGELQARDIVIATLKCEKVKQMLNQGRYRPVSLNEPVAALQRDSFAAAGPRLDEAQICSLADHQLNSLENLVIQQRRAQIRIAKVLKDAELRHRKVVQELIEEKRKHEHDTAQGDDITYGLEKERTRLKQELEMERQAKKRLEKELKKLNEFAEEEKNRQKQIVLLLLAERKKIVMKYVEERKRSEDLAQMLTEEKGRTDSMAEGLEEESKKSLQMEAELEKQLAQFDTESQQLKASLLKEEKRVKELELELEKAKGEVANLEKQLVEAHQVAMFQANTTLGPPMVHQHTRPPQPPTKPAIIPPQTSPRVATPTPGKPLNSGWVEDQVQAQAMMSSVAKVVQPTATVSSVPVCGPTTGVARSVSPGQGLRGVATYCPPSSSTTIASTTPPTPSTTAETEKRTVPRVAGPAVKHYPGQGGKVMFHVQSGTVVNPGTADGTKKQTGVGRGVPPPVPPNKPVVPPKKEAILGRRTEHGGIASDQNEQKPAAAAATTQGLKFGINVSKEAGKVGSASGNEEEEGSRRDVQVKSGMVGGTSDGRSSSNRSHPILW